MRRWFATIAIVVIVGTLAACSASTPTLDKAAKALRSQSVWVDPSTESSRQLTSDQVGELTSLIKSGQHHIYVAILPKSVKDEVDGDANRLVSEIGERTDTFGVYAIWGGDAFRAGASKQLRMSDIAQAATDSYASLPSSDTFGILKTFIAKVQAMPVPDMPAAGAKADDEDGDSWSTVAIVLIIVGIVVVIVIIFLLVWGVRSGGSGYSSGGTYVFWSGDGGSSHHHSSGGGYDSGGGGSISGDGGGGGGW